MENSNEETRRQSIKAKLNFILEPLLVDMLIKRPTDPHKFMREWLELRKDYLAQEQTSISTTRKWRSPDSGTPKQWYSKDGCLLLLLYLRWKHRKGW